MKGEKIQGEYKRVGCLTAYPYIMAMANEQLLSCIQTIQMIDQLREKWPTVLNEPTFLVVQFLDSDFHGTANAWKQKIKLPMEGPQLRAGLVLHEFAHILHASQGIGGSNHGPEFVKILDLLLRDWYLS